MGRTTVIALAGILAAGAGLAAFSLAPSTPAGAEDKKHQVTKEEVLADANIGRPGDIVMGDADAPLEVIEYASTTCGHCAAFKLRTFPDFKTAYIDTGIAKYVLREFPTSPVVLSASAFMLARCVPENRYYQVIDVLFRSQRDWAYVRTADEGRGKLKTLARQIGVGGAEFDACLSNDAEYQRIRAVQQQGSDVFGITGTPTIIVGDTVLSGYQTFEQLDAELAPLVPEAFQARLEEAKAALEAEAETDEGE